VNLLYCIRRANQVFGDRVAVRSVKLTLSYRELYQRVYSVAQGLRELGVQKGERVAVLMLNAPEYFELYWAICLVGAVIVPLNIRWSLEEMIYALDDSGSSVLVVDHHFEPERAQLAERVASLRTFIFASDGPAPNSTVAYAELLRWRGAAEAFAEPDEDDVVGLFYTSGTTGGPKAAMLSHKNLLANAYHSIIELGINQDWNWLHSAPMFHLADGTFTFALTLMGAGHTFIPAFDAEAFLRAIECHSVTSALLLPTMLNIVMNHPARDNYDTTSLRTIFYGGSPMPLELLRQAVERFKCNFVQGYGMTETSPLITLLHWRDHSFEDAGEQFAPIKSVGKPVVGVEVRIVDDADCDLPPGEVGEILARGANVMQGYWQRPEITAEILRGGWMHTGDMGTFDERGYLYILDRKKEMIRTGGENVYTPEVEAVIYTHPDILEAAVIGVPDERWGETIKAVVVLRAGREMLQRELIEYCRTRLTHFKCPTSVEFVSSLPKSGSGKIQKRLLKEKYWAGKEKRVN